MAAYFVLFIVASTLSAPYVDFSTADADYFCVKSIEECKHLPPAAFSDYINELGRRRYMQALLDLAQSGIPLAEYALTVYVRVATPQRAVQLCKHFPLNSWQWEYASWGLWSHHDKEVLQYVYDLHRNSRGWLRAYCYDLCRNAGWELLLREAALDCESNDLTGEPFLNLADHARLYLETVCPDARHSVRGQPVPRVSVPPKSQPEHGRD
jgi:hypothetical protein